MNQSTIKHIQSLNSLLLERLGSTHGIPNYQWLNGSDNVFLRLMPVYDSSGEIQIDNRCICGTNVTIHGPDCYITVPQKRLTYRSPWPWLQNRWVFSRFTPDLMIHGIRNNGGEWMPVGDQRKTLALLPDCLPDVTVTVEIIDAIRTNPSGKKLSGELIDKWKAQDKKRKERYKELAREAMPLSDPDKTQGSVFRQFSMATGKKG